MTLFQEVCHSHITVQLLHEADLTTSVQYNSEGVAVCSQQSICTVYVG